MTEEILTMENEELEVCDMDQESTGGNGLLGWIIGGVVVAAGVGAAWLYKNKEKLEEKQVTKLQKKGYVVYKPVVEEVVEEEIAGETQE